jgi:hypothetical protein
MYSRAGSSFATARRAQKVGKVSWPMTTADRDEELHKSPVKLHVKLCPPIPSCEVGVDASWRPRRGARRPFRAAIRICEYRTCSEKSRKGMHTHAPGCGWRRSQLRWKCPQTGMMHRAAGGASQVPRRPTVMSHSRLEITPIVLNCQKNTVSCIEGNILMSFHSEDSSCSTLLNAKALIQRLGPP